MTYNNTKNNFASRESDLLRWLETMSSRNGKELEARAKLLQYALPERLSYHQNLSSPATTSCEGPVWLYWAQGRDHAPPIVQSCLKSVERHLPDRDIIILDDNSIGRYIQPHPVAAERVKSKSRAHFSDMIRVELLHKYGGTWMDATVFLAGTPRQDMMNSEFFAFTRNADPYLLSNWFLTARPEHPLISAMREMLISYWLENEQLINYFIFHHLFECAVTINDDLKAEWQKAPRYSSYQAHEMQNRLMHAFNAPTFKAIKYIMPVQKLTYKVNSPANGSLFDMITREDPAIFV